MPEEDVTLDVVLFASLTTCIPFPTPYNSNIRYTYCWSQKHEDAEQLQKF